MNNREAKKIKGKVKSLQELRAYTKTLKSCYSSRAIVKLLTAKIKVLVDPNLHVTELIMTKDEFLLFQEFKQNKKKFMKWRELYEL